MGGWALCYTSEHGVAEYCFTSLYQVAGSTIVGLGGAGGAVAGIYALVDKGHLSYSPVRRLNQCKKDLAKIEEMVRSLEDRLTRDPNAPSHITVASGSPANQGQRMSESQLKDSHDLRIHFWRVSDEVVSLERLLSEKKYTSTSITFFDKDIINQLELIVEDIALLDDEAQTTTGAYSKHFIATARAQNEGQAQHDRTLRTVEEANTSMCWSIGDLGQQAGVPTLE